MLNVIMATIIMSFHNVHYDECHYAARRGDGSTGFREILHPSETKLFAKERKMKVTLGFTIIVTSLQGPVL
jgi:hypothetical protein